MRDGLWHAAPRLRPAVARQAAVVGHKRPIVVLSGEADGQQQAAALGVAGPLRKPFDLEGLWASVQRHLAAPAAACGHSRPRTGAATFAISRRNGYGEGPGHKDPRRLPSWSLLRRGE
jgi:hypothetical protein